MAWRALLFLFYFFLPSLVVGQEPLFSAIVSTNKVIQNTSFEVTFELREANGTGFKPPTFEGFKVVAGPSVGSSTMIVNGQVSHTETWTYILLAPIPGRFNIHSANVIAGNRRLASRPVTIEVLSTKDAGIVAGSDAESIILMADIADGKIYPGQQIVLQYKLLFRENVQSVNTISEDDYSGFYIQPFNMVSPQARYETINGQQYASRVIRSIALYAHQSGTYTIDPLIMDVGINVPVSGNQGFFTMRRLKNVQVASQPKTIEVLPLPPGPANFSGAVGQYSVNAVSGPTHITTDDDFTLRLEITGNGDSRRWDPPVIERNDDFELYAPRIENDVLHEVNSMIRHTRMVDYTMIPRQPGEYDVSIPFVFFNPESETYETIYSDTFHLQVLRGSGLARRTKTDSVQLNPGVLGKVSPVLLRDAFWTSVPHLTLFGISLLGACIGLIHVIRKKRELAIPREERIRSAAARHARQQLDELLTHPLDSNAFFEKATAIYNQFLIEKFSIPPSELDETNLGSYLLRAGIGPGETSEAVAFFRQCLTVRYAGIPTGFSKETLTDEIRTLIDRLGS